MPTPKTIVPMHVLKDLFVTSFPTCLVNTLIDTAPSAYLWLAQMSLAPQLLSIITQYHIEFVLETLYTAYSSTDVVMHIPLHTSPLMDPFLTQQEIYLYWILRLLWLQATLNTTQPTNKPNPSFMLSFEISPISPCTQGIILRLFCAWSALSLSSCKLSLWLHLSSHGSLLWELRPMHLSRCGP